MSVGLITSMDLVVPSDVFQVTSPTFTVGPAILAFAAIAQNPHEFWGGPSAGPTATGPPSFRALEPADLPVVIAERGGTNNTASLSGKKVMLSESQQIHESDPLFDGFLVIGKTGASPVPAAMVPAAGIQIVNGPGSIAIAATGACVNGTKFSTSCVDISNMPCPGGDLDTDCFPGTMTFDTLYVDNLIAINSTQRIIISANASILQVEHLIANQVQLSGDFDCIAGSPFGNIGSHCYDISGKTCTYPVDNTCLPIRIGSINGVLPDPDFGIISGGTGLAVTPTTNGIIVSNTGVTSVDLSVPANIFVVTSSPPVTTTGTLAVALALQSSNTLFASPASGVSPGVPSFRSQAIGDLPRMTNGQLYVGSSGTSVAATTLMAGPGLAVTNGAGSITIDLTATGTVQSVGLSLPLSIFNVSGSPVTTDSGTLSATLETQNQNLVFAGPDSGSAIEPTFRTLGVNDLAGALNYQYVSSVTPISGFATTTLTTMMGVTPAAGTYAIFFSGSFGPTLSPCFFNVGICRHNVAQTPVLQLTTQRFMTDRQGVFTVQTEMVMAVNGAQAIEACWQKISGSCTYTVYERTLVAIRVA